jgi:hypothetical protein
VGGNKGVACNPEPLIGKIRCDIIDPVVNPVAYACRGIDRNLLTHDTSFAPRSRCRERAGGIAPGGASKEE